MQCKQLLRSYRIRMVVWPEASLKVQKGECSIYLGFGSIEHPSNVTTWWMQSLWSYVIRRQLDLHLVWKFKSHSKTHPRFWCREHSCKDKIWCMQFLNSYHKGIWHRARLTDEKGHKIGQCWTIPRFYVVNTPLKLQYDANNFWWAILLTWYYSMPAIGLELVWKFKKVRQRSTSNSSVIYKTMHAILDKLSHSQGSLTLT